MRWSGRWEAPIRSGGFHSVKTPFLVAGLESGCALPSSWPLRFRIVGWLIVGALMLSAFVVAQELPRDPRGPGTIEMA